MEFKKYKISEISKSLFYGSMPKNDDIAEDGKYPIFSGYRFVGFSNKKNIDEPTLIVIARGVGGTGDVKIAPANSFLTNLSIAIDIDETVVDRKFLYYFLNVQGLRYLDTGAAQSQITINNLKQHSMLLPNLSIQKEIADILSTYDDLIENNNRRIALLEKAAQELYKEWFVRRKKDDWELVKLSHFGYSLESGARPKGGIDGSLQEGYPSLGAEAIGELGKFDYSATKLIPEDFYNKMKRGFGKDKDILLYKDGAYIGKVTLFMDEFPYKNYAINEHVFLMRSNNPIYQYYLYFTLALPQYFAQMQNLNRNAAQPGLTGKDIDILKLYRPDEETIKNFNTTIEPMLHNIFSLAKQNQNLSKQRELLLPRLMSGKLEV